MSEKTVRNVYWISTSQLAIAMLASGIQELRRVPELVEAAQRLGYPEYIFTILGTAKVFGAPLLVMQGFPRLKEWVYAGFGFDFGGAIISHTAVGDTFVQTLPAIFCASLLAISYGFYRRRDTPALREFEQANPTAREGHGAWLGAREVQRSGWSRLDRPAAGDLHRRSRAPDLGIPRP